MIQRTIVTQPGSPGWRSVSSATLSRAALSPDQLVLAAPELEALPAVAQRALALAREGADTSVEAIADLLGTDQALAAAVLRSANSGVAMPNQRTGNLREAVARIGLRRLWELLVSACAGPMLDRGLPPYAISRRTAWRHAATSSRAAGTLARHLRLANPEEASVAGLLHDVGKTVLTSVAPLLAAEVVTLARGRGLAVWQAEREVLGFDHGELSAALLRSWGFPEAVLQAVHYHHRPALTAEPLAAVAHLADAAAHLVGAVGGAGACRPAQWEPAVVSSLGLSEDDMRLLLDGLQCVDEVGLGGR